jgi:transcriptional regulator with XRE-family HTH domain
MSLREEIREAMKQRKVSAYFLAGVTGVHKSSISRFLSGKRGLGSASVDKLREALGLSNGK